ncbi:MAG: hypothetical protein IPI30_12235 [Saprospiraceae bacterium]|nr:hypothetical protein [Candidatus Vicinibacter affinis]
MANIIWISLENAYIYAEISICKKLMKRGNFLFILLICFNSCLANNCVNCCDVPLLEKYFNVNSKYNQHSEFKSDQFISPAPSCNILCNTDFEDDKLVALGRFGFS